jgi:Integrase zinc binding domain
MNSVMQADSPNINDIVIDDNGSPIAIIDEDSVIDRSSTTELIAEQQSDASLQPVLQRVKNSKCGYFMHKDILYHKEKIATQVVSQMVLLVSRRTKVMEMAHDSVYSGHLRFRKTLARIRLSFFWPGIRTDLEAYCASCKECQLRARHRVKDRVPIAPIARAPLPFHTLNMDVIGPIQDKGPYRYMLTIVGSCTHWP